MTPDQAPEDQEPRTPSEKYMASLGKELIGLETVRISHTFLGVGGNSLTLNIILNRIETERGVALSPQQFFDDDKSSVLELAKALDAALAGEPAAPGTSDQRCS